LQAAANALPDVSWTTMANQYRKYAHPMFGALGKADPLYEAYFSSLGNVKSELAKLQTSGSSRSMALLTFIQDHIPKESDPPDQAMQKIRTLEMGRFQSLAQAILGGAGRTTDTQIGTTPDGRPVYQDANGRKHL
jgi:hypothetical protein